MRPGEVACTGVHGATRLASNSRLEAVVFGHRAGRSMSGRTQRGSPTGETKTAGVSPAGYEREGNPRTHPWEYCGIARDQAGLERAISRLEAARFTVATPQLPATELRNIHQVALLIAKAGLWREESRGAHYRTDFSVKRAEFLKPSLLRSEPLKS